MEVACLLPFAACVHLDLKRPSLTCPTPPSAAVQQEAERLGTLVSDLLDLVRNDSGRIHLRCCLLVADDVLLELYERMVPQAAGRLRLDSCTSVPTASGGFHRLQQCLTALVDNALLYGHGPVILAANSGPCAELVLHVRGSGIGLSVVRLLIEAMGGCVQVAAHLGGGGDVQRLLPGGGDGVRAGSTGPRVPASGLVNRENTEALGGGTGVL
jgi:two-component system, OmpR family, sensor kinase